MEYPTYTPMSYKRLCAEESSQLRKILRYLLMFANESGGFPTYFYTIYCNIAKHSDCDFGDEL